MFSMLHYAGKYRAKQSVTGLLTAGKVYEARPHVSGIGLEMLLDDGEVREFFWPSAECEHFFERLTEPNPHVVVAKGSIATIKVTGTFSVPEVPEWRRMRDALATPDQCACGMKRKDCTYHG